MIADPAAIAVCCLAACSVVISDEWRIKPKKHDHWTQQARIWVCIVKPSGARGTDMLKAAFGPIEALEAELRRAYRRELAEWKEGTKGLKGEELKEAQENASQQERLLTNDATVEALSEMLI